MSTDARPEAAEDFYQANEALQDAEVDIFITLHKCFELRVNAHPCFRDVNVESIPTPESYLEHVDEVHQKVLDNPHYPPTPQDFAATYAQQCIWMRHLVTAIEHWNEALQKVHTTFEAWSGVSLDERADLALLHTGPIELDFLSHNGTSPAIALWLSVRLHLMSDRARNPIPGKPPRH
jgi:hypothetical protein